MGRNFTFTLSLQCPFRTQIYIIEKWKSYFSEMNIQYIPHQQLNIAFLPSERVWIHVSPAHIFFKRINLTISFIIWLLDCKLFLFDIWIAPGGGMLGKRHSLFIELCIIELPLSRVLVEFGLNSIHFGFLSNFNLEYQSSKFAWKLLLLKKFWVLFPKHFNHQKLQSIPFHNTEKIIVVITNYSGSEKAEAFSVLTTSSIL